MCPYSTSPTAATSDGLTTRRSHADTGLHARQSDDGVDVTLPDGLLPQLIQVIHVLSDGQNILSCRIRAARIEFSNHFERDTEIELPPWQPRPIPTDPIPTDRVLQGPAPIESVLSVETVPGSVPPSAAPPSPGAPARKSLPSELVNLPPGPTLDDVTERTTTNWRSPSRSEEPNMVTADRNYNFFDELDARLADLHADPDPSEGD